MTRSGGPAHRGKAADINAITNEPEQVASTAKELKLRHVVITSVTRDDLPDGGADQFSRTVKQVRRACPDAAIEVLTPDFNGNTDSIKTVADAQPDVFNHNLETVPRLYPAIRPEADYRRSLSLLKYVKNNYPDMLVKSGLMLGLGEKKGEVMAAIKDLREINCDAVTIGQYLRPVVSDATVPVERFIPPEEFAEYRQAALALGFKGVSAGPFVRSSYNAEILISPQRAQRIRRENE
jgi:lipoic acid synthetase